MAMVQPWVYLLLDGIIWQPMRWETCLVGLHQGDGGGAEDMDQKHGKTIRKPGKTVDFLCWETGKRCVFMFVFRSCTEHGAWQKQCPVSKTMPKTIPGHATYRFGPLFLPAAHLIFLPEWEHIWRTSLFWIAIYGSARCCEGGLVVVEDRRQKKYCEWWVAALQGSRWYFLQPS